MKRKVIKQQPIYEGRVIKVSVDTVEQPDGSQVIREVVRHPGGAVAVPILPDGRIVLVRQFRYPIGRALLELPAGKLDPAEPPEVSVLRELEEESGFRAGAIRKICEFFPTPGFCDEVLHIFIAYDLQPGRQHLEVDEEAMSVEIYSKTELSDMIARGEIVDGKTLVGLLWWLACPDAGLPTDRS
ncbi:MAG: NUDIX hydrolase [Acidobacteria bacterium]|nr:NUDIX hydrolase [Acidobacteriota bacterium]MBI3657765.1 NUDIX hydrolase [Acidobacteriota bacterium]